MFYHVNWSSANGSIADQLCVPFEPIIVMNIYGITIDGIV